MGWDTGRWLIIFSPPRKHRTHFISWRTFSENNFWENLWGMEDSEVDLGGLGFLGRRHFCGFSLRAEFWQNIFQTWNSMGRKFNVCGEDERWVCEALCILFYHFWGFWSYLLLIVVARVWLWGGRRRWRVCGRTAGWLASSSLLETGESTSFWGFWSRW